MRFRDRVPPRLARPSPGGQAHGGRHDRRPALPRGDRSGALGAEEPQLLVTKPWAIEAVRNLSGMPAGSHMGRVAADDLGMMRQDPVVEIHVHEPAQARIKTGLALADANERGRGADPVHHIEGPGRIPEGLGYPPREAETTWRPGGREPMARNENLGAGAAHRIHSAAQIASIVEAFIMMNQHDVVALGHVEPGIPIVDGIA